MSPSSLTFRTSRTALKVAAGLSRTFLAGLVLQAAVLIFLAPPSGRAAIFLSDEPVEPSAAKVTQDLLTTHDSLVAQARAQGLDHVQVDDMRFPIDGIGTLSSFRGTRWTDGIVYYTFDDTLETWKREIFRQGAAEWEAVAGLTFVEGLGSGNYIHVIESDGNWSYVGMRGFMQELSIVNWSKFIIAHELGHALGLIHEQSRPDRDAYVVIRWENIEEGKAGNFGMSLQAQNYGAYDFDSIMHYSKLAFSTNGLNTIETLPAYSQYLNTMGNLSGLSASDSLGMQYRYPYPAPPPPPTNVTASVDTSSQHILVTWSATQALGYRLFRHTVSNAAAALPIATAADTLFQDTTAIAGTYYYYWVSATNLTGESGLSLAARGRRNIPPLPSPANLTASRGDYLDHVNISYSPVPGATHYQIVRWPGGMSPNIQQPITGWMEGVTSFDDFDVKPYSYYYYAVHAAAGDDALGRSASAPGVRGYVTPPTLASDVTVALTNDRTLAVRIGNEAGCSWWWAAGARCINPDDFLVASINTNLGFEGHATAESGYDSEYGLQVKLVVANGAALGPTPCNFFVTRVHQTADQTAEFEGTGETLTPGQNPAAGAFDWPAGDVVEMWDVALSPGAYTITLHPLSGDPDFDLALFSPAQRFASRSQAVASASASGAGGDETLSFRVSQAGVYGLCVVANTTNAATFTLDVADLPFVWQGTLSTSWHFATNWVNGLVPHAGADVIIPADVPRMPSIVSESHAYCRSLTIEPGASLTVSGGNISNRWLHTSGDLTVRGTLSLPDARSRVDCQGNILWQSGSQLSAAVGAEIAVAGDWKSEADADVRIPGGRVSFQGALSSMLINHSALSAFGTLACEKQAGRRLLFSSASSKPLNVGDLIIETNAIFTSVSTQPVNIGRAVDNRNGHLTFLQGSCVFTNTPTLPLALNQGDTLHGLTLRCPGTLALSAAFTNTFPLTGSVVLQDGVLAANGVDLRVGGDWDARSGGVFSPHTNTVTFVGTSSAIYGDATFHKLREEKTTNALHVSGVVIVEASCAATHRLEVSGELIVEGLLDLGRSNAVLEVEAGGSVLSGGFDMGGSLLLTGGDFACEDIADAGLDGTVILHDGTAVLNQGSLPGDRFDLLGDVTVEGGLLRLTGGTSAAARWPASEPASLTVRGGVIEVSAADIVITNAPGIPWDMTFDGGILRFGGGLRVLRSDFQPAQGRVEFHGGASSAVELASGSWLPDFACGKTGAATLTASGELRVRGDVHLLGGTFAAPSLLRVEGGWSNAVGAAGFNARLATVRFAGSQPATLATGETFFDLVVDKASSDQSSLRVAEAQAVTVQGDLSLLKGMFELGRATRLDIAGDLSLSDSAALNADAPSEPVPIEIRLGGDWLNAGAGYSAEHGFNPGYSSHVLFTGSSAGRLVNASRETFNRLTLDRLGKTLSVETPLTVRGAFTILAGSIEQTAAFSHRILGDLTVGSDGRWAAATGTLSFEGRSAQLTYSATQGGLCDILADKAPGQLLALASDIPLAPGAGITVNGGTFDLGSHGANCSGDVTVGDGGTLQVGAGGRCTVGDGHKLTVLSGGQMNLFGAPDNLAQLLKDSGNYTLTIRDGGRLAATYASFRHMNDDGVRLAPGALLIEPHTLHHCVFADGADGGTLLGIENTQSFSVRQAVFEGLPGTGPSNVRKTASSGHVDFVAATGTLAGEDYDADANNLVDWHSGKLSGISLTIPSYATRGGSLTLGASVDGDVPLLPITYRWSVSEHEESVRLRDSMTDQFSGCRWDGVGTKTVSVSASNEFGVVSAMQDIEVATLACESITHRRLNGMNTVDLMIVGTSAASTYRVEFRTSLSGGTWLPAAPDGITVTGEDKRTHWTDWGGPGRDLASEAAIFYRAVHVAP